MKHFRSLLLPLAALGISLITAVGIFVVVGESPTVLLDAFHSTLFTSYGLGSTLYYTTPLLFTGLAVAVAFHCGLFNIGAEGQLYVGSLGVITLAYFFPGLSPWLAIPLSVLAAGLAGGLYGALPGFLRAYRGSHEVIVTILLNFVAYAFVDYFILYPFRNPESPNPESFLVPESYRLSFLADICKNFHLTWFENTPVNTSFLFALLVSFLIHFLLFRTTWGFELRAVGQSSRASRYAGISVRRSIVIAFFLSGALAGLVGLNQISGSEHRLAQGFSPQYGFTGIAVAMLARNQPLAVIFPAFLFGAFQNASREIEFNSEKITKELSFVIQGALIAIMSAEYLWGRFFRSIQERVTFRILKRRKSV